MASAYPEVDAINNCFIPGEIGQTYEMERDA